MAIDPNDIIGKKINRLTVVKYLGKEKEHRYKCQCECGKTTVVRRGHLLNGTIQSCGCANSHTKKNVDYSDLLGRRFGKLVVKEYLGLSKEKNKGSVYLCQCDCGNVVEITRNTLKSGRINNCGSCAKIVKENDYYRYICANGESWIFDASDLDLVKSRKWHISSRGYPSSYDPKRRNEVAFHKLAIVVPPGKYVDHIDGDTRNNRRENFRFAAPIDNTHNKCIMPYNSTGYKGISFCRNRKSRPYRSAIKVNHKYKNLGYYNTPEEAARTYDEAARFYFGEFACVNFPQPGEQCCRRNQEQPESINASKR